MCVSDPEGPFPIHPRPAPPQGASLSSQGAQLSRGWSWGSHVLGGGLLFKYCEVRPHGKSRRRLGLVQRCRSSANGIEGSMNYLRKFRHKRQRQKSPGRSGSPGTPVFIQAEPGGAPRPAPGVGLVPQLPQGEVIWGHQPPGPFGLDSGEMMGLKGCRGRDPAADATRPL